MQPYLLVLLTLASHRLSILCNSFGASPTDLAVHCDEPPDDGPYTTCKQELHTSLLPADLAKRNQPTVVPPPPTPASSSSGINSNLELFTGFEEAGWVWRFIPDHWFSPSYTSSGFLIAYLDQCIALVAAQMLANAVLTARPVVFGPDNPLVLTIDAYERCAGCERRRNGTLTWVLVSQLLLYLRNHAARGFTGTGSLYLIQGDGDAAVMMTLKLRDGYGRVVPQTCGASSRC
ncbi:MAG: hypothetical protein Q9207_006990 [Kuettlingeria erythrocarpa]